MSTSKTQKGIQGEEIVFNELKKIFGEDAIIFRNIIVQPRANTNKPFECDIICVSKRGVFVFEVKNWQGHIEADLLSPKWGVKKSYENIYNRYDNPVIQNNVHKKCLDEILGTNVISIVVMNDYNNQVTMKKYSQDQVNVAVLFTSELHSYFSTQYLQNAFTEQEFYSLFSKLKEMELASNQLRATSWEFNNNTQNTEQINAQQSSVVNALAVQPRKKKSPLKIAALVIIFLGFSLAAIMFFGARGKQTSRMESKQNNSTKQQIAVPEAVSSRHRYSIEELENMPIINVDNNNSTINLKQSIAHNINITSYVENYTQKNRETIIFMTPVEFVTGTQAGEYYKYLHDSFGYERELREKDHEQFVAIRFYVWYDNDEVDGISYSCERYAESIGHTNSMINFNIKNDSLSLQNFYLSNETGQNEYLTGCYCEDLDSNAIIDSTIKSKAPVECIYLIALSQDFDYVIRVNPQYYVHNGIYTAVLETK